MGHRVRNNLSLFLSRCLFFSVSVCLYFCICMYICMCVCVYIYIIGSGTISLFLSRCLFFSVSVCLYFCICMYICMCVCVCIYIYNRVRHNLSVSVSLSLFLCLCLSLFLYMYVYMYVCVCVCIYIHTHCLFLAMHSYIQNRIQEAAYQSHVLKHMNWVTPGESSQLRTYALHVVYNDRKMLNRNNRHCLNIVQMCWRYYITPAPVYIPGRLHQGGTRECQRCHSLVEKMEKGV